LNHHITVQVLHNYPIQKYSIAFRLIAWLMKYKIALLLYLIIEFRDKSQSSRLLTRILKKVNVGIYNS